MRRYILLAAMALGVSAGLAGPTQAAPFHDGGIVAQPVQFYGRGHGPGHGYYGPRHHGPRLYARPFRGPGHGYYGRGYAYRHGYYGHGFYR